MSCFNGNFLEGALFMLHHQGFSAPDAHQKLFKTLKEKTKSLEEVTAFFEQLNNGSYSLKKSSNGIDIENFVPALGLSNTLDGLPEPAYVKIGEHLVLSEILSLRKVNYQLREVMKVVKPNGQIYNLSIRSRGNNNYLIQCTLGEYISNLWVKYDMSLSDTGKPTYYVSHFDEETDHFDEPTEVNNVDRNPFFDDLKLMLEHQKSELNMFRLDVQCDMFCEKMEEIMEPSGIKLKVDMFDFGERTTQNQLVTVFRWIESIDSLQTYNGSEEVVELDELVNTELWKKIKMICFDKMPVTVGLEHFMHCKQFYVKIQELQIADVIQLRELLCAPNSNRKFSIEFDNIDRQELFGYLGPPSEMNGSCRRWYPVDNKEWIQIDVHFHRVPNENDPGFRYHFYIDFTDYGKTNKTAENPLYHYCTELDENDHVLEELEENE